MRLALKTLAVSGAAAFLAVAAAPAASAAYYEMKIPTTGCTFYTQAGADANPQHNPPVELDEDTDVGVRDC